MSDGNSKSNGFVTFRSVVGVGLAILGALLLFVLDVVKDTAKAVGAVQVQLGTITGSYGAKIEDHDRRIGALESWRNTFGRP